MANFYLDHDVPIRVAAELHLMGHQAVVTRHLGAERDPDYLQLLRAAQQGWILVTHNGKDFQLFHGAWRAWQQEWGTRSPHAGVLILAQAHDALQRADYARILHAFIEGTTGPLENRLFRYQMRTGWVEAF